MYINFLSRTYGLSILSPDDDEGSCHSSRLSNKSEKNMADFDGEEGLSEEELVQINNHVRFTAQQAFPHMGVLYPSQTRGMFNRNYLIFFPQITSGMKNDPRGIFFN